MSQKYTLVSGSVLLPPPKLMGSQGGHNAMGEGEGKEGDITFQYGLRAWRTQALSIQKWAQGRSIMS